MSKAKEKAGRVRALLADETFKNAIDEVRNAQSRVFLNSGSTPEAREEAHAIIRALAAIENTFATAFADEAMFDKKKGQHRGSD